MSEAFSLSEEQQLVLEAADRYARDRIAPLARRMDDEEWWPDKEFRELGKNGYFGITVPPELGGAGLDLWTSGLVLQAFSRWNPAFALSWVAHENLCLNNIYRNGNAEQHRRYLPGLCDGSLIGSLALTEPGAGSDALGSMATTALKEGDEYVINGHKLYITNGPIADIALLYAKTDQSRGPHGISAFILDLDSSGVSVAQKLNKMGFRGSQTAELALENCRVPAHNLVGAENAGVHCVMSGLDLERAMISPLCVGIGERALDLTIDFAKAREQFGQPIANFQMVQSHIVDMYVALDTMRVYNWHCLAALNELTFDQGGRGWIHKMSASSVMYCANALNQLLDRAVQVHGGNAYIWETEINRLYRTIKLLEIGAGTTEIRKIVIAEELLKE